MKHCSQGYPKVPVFKKIFAPALGSESQALGSTAQGQCQGLGSATFALEKGWSRAWQDLRQLEQGLAGLEIAAAGLG